MQARPEQPSDGEFYFPNNRGGLVGLALAVSLLALYSLDWRSASMLFQKQHARIFKHCR
jgi:hypothetical protein